jgi:DNA-binding transcriptional LysR family regulator
MTTEERPAGAAAAHSDLRMLRCFVVVAEELHFARAARRLVTTQATVSRTIRTLEAQFGVELLDRSTRQVELTDAGRLVLSEGRELVARHQALVATIAALKQGCTERPKPDRS